MPTVAVKLYSVFFKFLVKHRLQSRIQSISDDPSKGRKIGDDSFGVTTRPEESVAASNPVFTDGVATKDIHIDTLTSLSVRIFLPETALFSDPLSKQQKSRPSSNGKQFDSSDSRFNSHIPNSSNPNSSDVFRRNSVGSTNSPSRGSVDRVNNIGQSRRNSYASDLDVAVSLENGVYRGYQPVTENKRRDKFRKLPVMVQFHGGGFVSGSNDSVANDFFCRRVAKLCDVIVLAVGYRLAPESRYPAAFEDGWKVMNWLAKQANLAECSKSLVADGRGGIGIGIGDGGGLGVGADAKKSNAHRNIVNDTFGSSMVEPWLAAHGDPSRCVLLGVSCGANIVDYVACKAVEARSLLDPVKVVAQVLMYPFFMGSKPTASEIKLANSYFYDKAMCLLAWKLFLPEEDFNLDHPAANPLRPNRSPPLKLMPPTLTIVAELDWMRDRAIAYSEELRKVNVDAPVLEYKDAVHEFATLDMLLKTPQAQACAEDISIWVKKYISLRGHELSY